MVEKPTYEELEQKVLGLKKAELERRIAEEALRENEALYRELFVSNPHPMWIYDLESLAFLEVNNAAISHYGYSREEFLAMTIKDIRPAEDVSRLQDNVDRVSNGLDNAGIWRHIRKDRSVIMVEITSHTLLHNQHRAEIVLAHDITEQKRAEEALRRSEAKFRDLVENINDVIYSTNEKGELTYISPTIEGVLGYFPSEIIGKNFTKYIHPDDLAYVIEQFSNVVSGELKPSEYRILAKSGRYHWIRSSSKPIYEGDKLAGLTGMFSDITERKRLESELVQAQKMESIGTLAGGIAHDFNNILSAVIGYTELAQTEAEKGTVLYDNLQKVLQAGGRAKDLVNQILTFSRQAEKERKPVQARLIVAEALKFLRASLPTTIEIRRDIRSDALVMADPTQVHQVLMNLCTNAGHAMREKGGVLTVKLDGIKLEADSTNRHPELKPGPYLELTVNDTGSGIPSQILDRIFDPFFTTKEKGEGTGMGLSVVHGIVGSCGGKITVTSKQGQGTNFKVIFPAVERQIEHQAGMEESLPTGNERILFIDDEPALVDLGKRTLESLGYEVTTRISSYEALELFKAKSDSFDLVITDLTMPNMSGDDLAKELKRISAKTPVILCTGYSARINEEQAIAAGIRALVSKPVLRKEIARTIRKVLDDKIY